MGEHDVRTLRAEGSTALWGGLGADGRLSGAPRTGRSRAVRALLVRSPFLVLPWMFIFLPILAGCGSDKPTQVGDTIPPATVEDLTFARISETSVRLTWTAPGDDGVLGHAAAYSVRYTRAALTEQQWDSAAAIPSPPTPTEPGRRDGFIVTMPAGHWHIGVRAADEVPNWSGISNQVVVLVGDSIPPAAVSDLRVIRTTAHSATLAWTAPGDDGTRGQATEYDLRSSGGPITSESFDSATRAVGLSAPAGHGLPEEFTVDGLDVGATYFFALKCADEVPNWSGMSNVTSAEMVDAVAPGAITDLAARSLGESSIELTWTAPGNDGDVGTAAAYEMRYSLEPLDPVRWDGATAVSGLPSPASTGSAESFVLQGLEATRTYYVRLRARDERSNWSPLSNVVTAAPGTNPLARLTYSTAPETSANDASWSPDGQKIAFGAYWDLDSGSPRTQIYAMPSSGGEAEQLTHIDAGARSPVWSPDGTRLAFISLRVDGSNTIQELSVMGATAGSPHTVLFTAPIDYTLGQPCWSPDGTRIAFVLDTDSWWWEPGSSTLLSVSADGGGGSELVVGWYAISSPSWSPDGTRIVFAGLLESGDRSAIWVAPADGGDAVRITSGQTDDYTPAWSPDGTRIAFASWRMMSIDLWVMSPTGTNPTRLTADAFSREYGPSWSPDGSAIAFTSQRSDIRDIWVLSMR
jgi:Tol biopolymer transport system component